MAPDPDPHSLIEPWWVSILTPAEKQFMYSEIRGLWFQNTQRNYLKPKQLKPGRPR